jgi:peptidoglycan/xylan/chitin deacetylase (PgdA/CDA1 family)
MARPRFRLPAALLAALAASGSSAAGAASAQPVAILAYHHIGAAPHGTARPQLWVRPALLRRQLAALDRAGYTAVTLQRAWRAWHGGEGLPAHAVILSFDDGYSSQARFAGPALRAHRWPGVLNLQVGRLGAPGGLTRAQVRRLIRVGWEIDAHSVTHPDLTRVSAQRLDAEVAGSRRAIRRTFGVPADFFAYPFGRQDARVRAAVRRAGFLGATTIRAAFASPRTDPFALGRVLVPAGRSPAALLQMLRSGG